MPSWLLKFLPGLIAAAFYMGSVHLLSKAQTTVRHGVEPVSLPVPIQILVHGGDRFLAANTGAFRTMVGLAEITDSAEVVSFIARQLSDAMWLNPGHEDNYYLAAGLLSGSEQHATAQTVLAAAANARPFDFQPTFFYAFNLMYYERRYADAAQWMFRAAERDDDVENRESLHRIAVRWAQRGEDPARVAEMLEVMANSSHSDALKEYTLKRATQARQLVALGEAQKRFVAKTGREAKTLDEMVQEGILQSLPEDPVGAGFELDKDGRPVTRLMRKGGAK